MPETDNNITPAQVEPKKTPALMEVMTSKINSYLEKRTLHLPADYSPQNALRGAILKLQEDGVLKDVSSQSVIRALETMIIQGLSFQHKQCYFIVYGQSLQCQRSYFGDIALAKRIRPGTDVYYELVHEGDEFEYDIKRGRKFVTKHVQSLDAQDKPIIAAYCGVVNADGEDQGAEVMTMKRIKDSWSMSKTYNPANPKCTHVRFEGAMSLRTVIRSRLKDIINSSTDELLMESIRQTNAEQAEAELDAQIAEHGNGDVIVVEAEDTPEDIVPMVELEAPAPATVADAPEAPATAEKTPW